eukprot:4524570-Pyramimonas_sp.AAC.1
MGGQESVKDRGRNAIDKVRQLNLLRGGTAFQGSPSSRIIGAPIQEMLIAIDRVLRTLPGRRMT